jgi:DNA methylase
VGRPLLNRAAPLAPAGLRLDWSERDLPQRERTRHVHGLHPYLGKFIPQVVETLLRRHFAPGQTVLDPFCGSGTTLVQANEMGIHAVGVDVSAFNVLLARAKTARYDLPRLRREVAAALERAATTDTAGAAGGGVGAEADAYLREWYAPEALRQLLAYRAAVAGGGHHDADLLRVILSRAARSARLTTHYELDFPRAPQREAYWCHKHRRICRPATEALRFLGRYSADTVRRVEAFAAVRTGARVAVEHADSRGAEFPPADGVLTSPPYAGLIDYHGQHAYAFHLLGLAVRQTEEIGAPAAGNGRAARRGYQEDVALVLRRAGGGAAAPGGPPHRSPGDAVLRVRLRLA